MKFYLVKNKSVEFSNPPETPTDQASPYHIRDVKVEAALKPKKTGNDSLCPRDCAMLKNFLEEPSTEEDENDVSSVINCPYEPPLEEEKEYEDEEEPLNWDLCVAIGMLNTTSGNTTCGIVANGGMKDKRNKRDFIRVTGSGTGNILKRFEDVCEKHQLTVQLKVEIKNLTPILISKHSVKVVVQQHIADTIVTNEVDISELSSENKAYPGTTLHTSGYLNRGCWNSKGYQIKGTLTISGYVYSQHTSIFTPPRAIINKKILDEELYNDLTITTSDKKSVKCHKCLLSVHSSVLNSMFKNPKGVCTIEMDMSEASVKAFLAYLYYGEIEESKKDCAIVLDLFLAGIKYSIRALEDSMEKVLLSKPDSWYTGDVALGLFMFAADFECSDDLLDYRNTDDLKTKAVKLIKMNKAGLKNSPVFDKLFKQDPNAAKELYLLSFPQFNTIEYNSITPCAH